MKTPNALKIIAGSVTVMAGLLTGGCGKHHPEEGSDDILLAYGDSVLTLQAVVGRIPVGLAPSDSGALFKKIVSEWVEDMVLTDMAKAKLPDYEEIDRMVMDYRNRLIVRSYLSMMRANGNHRVSEDSVRRFYERFRGDMRAERPLVKGLLLKVPDNVNGLGEIKRCLYAATDESLDELEREWATDAVQYDYFGHTWVDWQVIAEQIPYRFFDPDAFLASTKNFETTSGGSVYLLHISEYLPTGSELPYEFASTRIMALLEKANMKKYEEDLVAALVKKSIDEEKLRAVGYDPVKRGMLKIIKEKETKNNNNDK